MCGIIAFAGRRPAAAPLLAGLSFLQHRGQDACGVATIADGRILRRRGSGLLREVFSQADATDLRGEMGIGHVRYPTAGGAFVESEAQPLYVNQPFGMVLAHNGNIVNAAQLRARLAAEGRRHINSDSDSEVLLNLLANLIAAKIPSARREIAPDIFFDAVAQLHAECVGAYAVVVAVAGQGILAFRDPCGIRPLCLAAREGKNGAEWLIASESVVQRPLGFDAVADIGPGEAVFIDSGGELHRRSCAAKPLLAPCLFEFIYFARPRIRFWTGLRFTPRGLRWGGGWRRKSRAKTSPRMSIASCRCRIRRARRRWNWRPRFRFPTAKGWSKTAMSGALF